MRKLGILTPKPADIRVELGGLRDGTFADAEALADFIEAEHALEPWSHHEVAMLELSGETSRWRRADLATHWRHHGLRTLAKRLDALLVPRGFIAIAIVGDEGPRIDTWSLDGVELPTVEHHPGVPRGRVAP